MQDTGLGTHGTVKVRIEGRDWLVDSSLLANALAPCDDQVYIGRDPVWSIETEPVGGAHLIWFDSAPSGNPLTCRVPQDPADPGAYVTAYEASRQRSPFNLHVYARKNAVGEVRMLMGSTRYSKTAAGVERRPLQRDELPQVLRDAFGISRRLVDQLARPVRWKRRWCPGLRGLLLRRQPASARRCDRTDVSQDSLTESRQ